MQKVLIDQAKCKAKQQHLERNCEFHAGDLANVDLSDASVVFLYFPPMALPALLGVLQASNLRNGATVVSADGAWKTKDAQQDRQSYRHAQWEHTHLELMALLQPLRLCWGTADLYFYTWRGNAEQTLEASAADASRAMRADAAVKAAKARVTARAQAEKAAEEAREAEVMARLEAARLRLLELRMAAPKHLPRPGSARRAPPRKPKPRRPIAPRVQRMLDQSPYGSKVSIPPAWTVNSPLKEGIGTVFFPTSFPSRRQLERAYLGDKAEEQVPLLFAKQQQAHRHAIPVDAFHLPHRMLHL